jgi:Na+(H+)/acetate symporter ActP
MTPIFATVDYYILAFSAITVVVTIWMGFRSAKTSKTASDFFVAGRSVSVGWNASAISGEYLSAASFMGIAGMVMSSGYDALWYPVCYACGYLFLLLFIAGPLRRFGAYTIPDFAEGRYDSPLFRKIAVCFVLFIGFFYTMPQMKGAGTTLAYIFPGLPYWAGVVLVGAVITLNVALGGMKGITLVQAFQYWAKMFAISVPIFVLMAVYGHYGKQLEVNGNVQHPTSNVHLSTNAPNAAVDVRSSKLNLTPNRLAEFFLDPWEVNLMYGGALQNVEATAQRFDVVNTTLTLRTPTSPLDAAVATYESLRPHVGNKSIVYLDKSIPGGKALELNTSSFPPWKGAQPASSVKQKIEQVFRANGLEIVEMDSRSVAIVTTTNLSKLSVERFSLPEKSKAANGSIAVSTTVTLPVVDGWVTIEPPNPVAQVEQRIKELVGQGRTWRNIGDAKLISVLMELSEHEGRRVVAHTNLVLTRMLGNLTVDQTNRLGVAAQLRGFLTNKDVGLLETRAGDILAVQQSQAAGYSAALQAESTAQMLRKPLPEKAPKDETWLSPFGPLTTKAAKAAGITGEAAKPYSLLYTYSLIIALICGTAGLPHILVRFYTNPDGGAAKRTTMWVMILIGIFYVFPPVFGVMGRNLFPELYNGIGAKGTDKIVLELPRLLNEKYAPLGSILSGITCAGAFAAFMSTFSGLLVSMTGALAHDVYGRMLRPKSTPEQRMRMFKFAAVLIGFVSILLGSLVEPLEINFMVGQAFAIAAASYFPLLFMSVWWRGMTMRGAAVGMLTGGLCALIAATLTNVSNLALDKGPMGKIFSGFAGMNDFWAQHPLLRILCEQPAIWTVPLAITLMIVVSKATRKDVPSDVRMKMLVLHAPEKLGLKQEYIQEHQAGH